MDISMNSPLLIGVMSDSHNNRNNLRKAIEILNERYCSILIHCGDYTSSDIFKEFRKFNGKVYGVSGNIDEDKYTMKAMADMVDNFHFMGIKGEIEVDGKKIAFSHFPDMVRPLAGDGDYHAIFYGHTHVHDIKKVNNKTWFVNPGEIVGRNGKSSCIIYNISTEEFEKIDL